MSQEQMRLLRGKSSSHSLITSAMLCEQKQNEKRSQTQNKKTKPEDNRKRPKASQSHKEYCNYR